MSYPLLHRIQGLVDAKTPLHLAYQPSEENSNTHILTQEIVLFCFESRCKNSSEVYNLFKQFSLPLIQSTIFFPVYKAKQLSIWNSWIGFYPLVRYMPEIEQCSFASAVQGWNFHLYLLSKVTPQCMRFANYHVERGLFHNECFL